MTTHFSFKDQSDLFPKN